MIWCNGLSSQFAQETGPRRLKIVIFIEFSHLLNEPEERMMAVCLVMQFAGVDTSKYEAVMEKLGLRSANPN